MNMDVTDDEADYVLKEIPVYLCNELRDKLYLFQFPCRSADTTCNSKNIVSSRVKPNSGIIELDTSLNTDNKFYDKYVGEDMAVGSASKQSGADKQRKSTSKLLDKITLQSQRSILKKDITCYSVGGLYDGKFCISSLHDSVSFLPTYDHVEKSKKMKSKTGNVSTDSSSSSDDEVEEGSSAVQVTVKFSQRNAEKSKISHELNHHQYMTKISEEPWCETTFFNNTSPTAVTTMKGLSKTVNKKMTPMVSLSEEQYLDVLIPSDSTSSIQEVLRNVQFYE